MTKNKKESLNSPFYGIFSYDWTTLAIIPPNIKVHPNFGSLEAKSIISRSKNYKTSNKIRKPKQ